MKLDKIVDAYLAVAEMLEEPGCPLFVERISPETCANPPAMLLKHLGETIRQALVTDDGTPRNLTHRGRPLVWRLNHRRWRLEDTPVAEDTTHIEVKQRG